MLLPTCYSWLRALFLLLLGLAATAGPAQAATELEGYVPEITTERLFFDGKYYPLVQGDAPTNAVRWPQATECHMKISAGYQLTCGTLAQVGYIHKARLRIENGKVARVEVLELMQ